MKSIIFIYCSGNSTFPTLEEAIQFAEENENSLVLAIGESLEFYCKCSICGEWYEGDTRYLCNKCRRR